MADCVSFRHVQSLPSCMMGMNRTKSPPCSGSGSGLRLPSIVSRLLPYNPRRSTRSTPRPTSCSRLSLRPRRRRSCAHIAATLRVYHLSSVRAYRPSSSFVICHFSTSRRSSVIRRRRSPKWTVVGPPAVAATLHLP